MAVASEKPGGSRRQFQPRPEIFGYGSLTIFCAMMRGGISMEPEYQAQAHGRISRVFTIILFAVILLVVFGAFTLFQRRAQYQALAKETEALAIPTVAVFHPTVEAAQEDLVLPGTMQAYVESPIYARTSGYLKRWYHDIGTRVKRGEPLAEIDTPEVDQELSQAQATRQQILANVQLSEITAAR